MPERPIARQDLPDVLDNPLEAAKRFLGLQDAVLDESEAATLAAWALDQWQQVEDKIRLSQFAMIPRPLGRTGNIKRFMALPGGVGLVQSQNDENPVELSHRTGVRPIPENIGSVHTLRACFNHDAGELTTVLLGVDFIKALPEGVSPAFGRKVDWGHLIFKITVSPEVSFERLPDNTAI